MSKWNSSSLARGLVWLAVVATVLGPQTVAAVELTAPSKVVAPRDVALASGGVLTGQLVDKQGVPQPLGTVAFETAGKEIARLQADSEGNFRIASLKGGIYKISAGGSQEMVRLWAPNTAPPVATQGITLVARGDLIRGQYAPMSGGPFTTMGQWMADHPIATAGIVATAIAVPIALANNDDDPASP